MVNAFSFCLYGPYNPKYYIGLKENIEIIDKKFPDFHIYIMCGSDVDDKKVFEILNNFSHISNKLKLYKYDVTGPIIMLFRYFVIDYDNIECVFSRDTDSRIGERDIWCINKFLLSPFILHTIRDHKFHFVKMMGGLTGIKKDILKYIGLFSKFAPINIKAQYNYDQYILSILYNNFKNLLLVHSTKNIFEDINYEKIPFEVNKENFCGQVIDYDQNNKPYFVFDYTPYD